MLRSASTDVEHAPSVLACSIVAAVYTTDRVYALQSYPAARSRRGFAYGEAACARHLAERRWPDGVVCRACGGRKGWALKRWCTAWKYAAYGKDTSVSAGTIMHRSHLLLTTWFTTVHIVTSHSNGVSTLRLQAQLGLGSDKTA